MTVQLFIPCIIDQHAPHLASTLTRLLDRLGVAWSYPATQTCCGQFAYNTGDFKAARRLLRHFSSVFTGTDPILSPGASCVLTVRRHYQNLVDTPAEAAQLHILQNRLQETTEWLVELPAAWRLSTPLRLVLHESCSARQLGIIPQVRRLLTRVEHLTLLDPPAHHACCGFGGLFSVTQPALAAAIGLAYLQAIQQTGAAGLLSTDAGCLLHLQRLIDAHRLPLQALHLVEVLSWAADPGSVCLSGPPPQD